MIKYKQALILAIALFILASVLFFKMGGEFIPTLEEGDLAIDFQTPQGSSLQTSIDATTRAQKALIKHFPEIQQIVGRIGASEVPTDPMPPEMSDLMINLKPKNEWVTADNKDDLVEKMTEVLTKEVPGTSVEFTQPIEMRFNEMIAGSKSEFAIKIFGNDLDILDQKAHQIEKLLYKIEGTGSVKIERISKRPQINIEYDRKKMASYGLNISDLNTLLTTSFAGMKSGVYFENSQRFDVVVRLQSEMANDINQIKNLSISTPAGALIRFEEIAKVNYQPAPSQISREKSNRRIIIGIGLGDRDIESYAQEVEKAINQNIDLPSGYYVSYGGSFENLVHAKNRLLVALPVAMILILFLLYFSLGTVRQAVLVFTAIPFSAIGGVFALLIRDMPFSISAGVGFIALFGIAVLNGLVLISYFNQSSETDLIKKIKTGVEVRFRPVITTALVASMGFLPMAVATSAGAEVQKPLATVVIGGLITSTLLTLVLLPVIFYLMERKTINTLQNEK